MSISIKGLTYHRLKRWCDANGKTVSGVIEEWSEARLRSNSPTTPRCLYVAELPDGLQWIIAVNENAALGFINEENIGRFAAAKPMLWEVSHMLAKLLLASRLGVEDIPEEAVRSALTHLQRVIEGLGRLKMLKEHGVKTSAARKPSFGGYVGGRLIEAASPVGFAR